MRREEEEVKIKRGRDEMVIDIDKPSKSEEEEDGEERERQREEAEKDGLDIELRDDRNIFAITRKNLTELAISKIESGEEAAAQLDSKGNSLLHWAAMLNSPALITSLCARGAQIEGTDMNGMTPLHWAAHDGKLSCCVELLHFGASINSIDKHGFTPLSRACQRNHLPVVKLLSHFGGEMHRSAGPSFTPLHWAAHNDHKEVVAFLMRGTPTLAAVDPNEKSSDGNTALHIAAKKKNHLAFVSLAGYGADTTIPNKEGKYCDDILKEEGDKEFAMLVRAGRAVQKYGRNIFVGYTDLPTPAFYYYNLFFSTLPLLLLFYIIPRYPSNLLLALFTAVGSIGCDVFLVKAARAEPGLIKAGVVTLLEIRSLLIRNRLQSDVCMTCRGWRPLRSKHSRQMNRCVAKFDHYCPWIYNDVGYNNHRYFLLYLLFQIIGLVSFQLILAPYVFSSVKGGDYRSLFTSNLVFFVLFLHYCFFTLFIGLLAATHSTYCLTNFTSNESVNWHRYEHFKGADGSYNNPFSMGMLRNAMEFFHLTPTPADYVDVRSATKRVDESEKWSPTAIYM
uniref:Palmitoyltransferase n=1 Tax=Palpitomonas bilix TaxID=652834 RepID=A0A7S3DJE5_9EUKA|mmetsp:Transcript_40547/g.105243  ORF Transcript_40547/g.105243 Transcript_40547/m.105243 type:complete len:563 (+) Transcript_40547:168-1856(+)